MQKENIARLNSGNIVDVKYNKRINIKRKMFIRNFIDSILTFIGAVWFPVVTTVLIALYLKHVGEPLRYMEALIFGTLLYTATR